jgi:hypothetical protein
MNGRQRLVVQSINNARVFLEGLNVTAPELVAACKELETACDDLRKAEARQAAAHPGAHGKGLSNLRRELRVVHLLRIRKRGRVLLKGLPGIDDSLRVPHDRAPTQDLIAAAKRIADAVRPHAKAFYAANFAKDFIKRMERAADALAKAAAAPPDAKTDKPRATRDLKDAISDARLVVDSLDGLMAAHYPRRSVVLVNWKKAKRVSARIGRPRKRTIERRKKLQSAD